MEFNEKLQELRKKKGLTQEELAEALCVSRTAVSKWESGRGYPNLDSLKDIARFFSLTIDELLSGDEVLTIATEEGKRKESYYRDIVFGLLDCSAALFLFLPLFAERVEGVVYEASLLSLTAVQPYLRVAYFGVVIAMMVWGILILALQNSHSTFWIRSKNAVSLLLGAIGVLLFIISSQPYAAVLMCIFLTIKLVLLTKKK